MPVDFACFARFQNQIPFPTGCLYDTENHGHLDYRVAMTRWAGLFRRNAGMLLCNEIEIVLKNAQSFECDRTIRAINKAKEDTMRMVPLVFLIISLGFPAYAVDSEPQAKHSPAKAENVHQEKGKTGQDSRQERRKADEMARFERKKASELEKLDRHIEKSQEELAAMQAERTCVQASASSDELRGCRKIKRDTRSGGSQENKAPK